VRSAPALLPGGLRETDGGDAETAPAGLPHPPSGAALLTYEGTGEIQTFLVGRDVTGQSAFA
jgi:hypothetical protein